MPIPVSIDNMSLQANKISAEQGTSTPSTKSFSIDNDATATSFASMEALKRENPAANNIMMRAIQNGILSQLRRQHNHLKEALKKARQNG